jgi:ankyrin repeat protein
MVHCLCSQIKNGVGRVDLLILDWKNPPRNAAKEVSVSLHRGALQKNAMWGSREQLAAAFPASAWSLAICTQSRRLMLDFTGQLKARRHLAMAHDYNIPCGPWQQEQTAEQVREHARLCEKFQFLCASQHLSDFVEKWSEGRFKASCCYAADYNYFDHPAPSLQSPWEHGHKYVSCVSPCPEKGLSILAKLAELMPEVPFLVVKTAAWTKPWHEQLLKRFTNVRLQTATESVDDFLSLTRVLLVPSVGQEAFGLLALEAQLRGIPVLSTNTCGLAEANQVRSCVIEDVPIVYDQRTHELVFGMTVDEAENTLPLDRPGCLTMEQARQTVINQENYQRLADSKDIERFTDAIKRLLSSDEDVQRASQEARLAANSFVEGRRDRFLRMLDDILEAHVAAGDAKPASIHGTAIGGTAACVSKPKQPMIAASYEEDDSFDVNQDFAKVQDFDGLVLAARCLVRLCEAGNLTVAAELLQAKADVNLPEPDIGVTPLVGAAHGGHLDVCKYLIRKEADVNSVVRDGTDRTALHSAARMGFSSVVLLLLEKEADPKAQDLTKTHPLHLACKFGHAGSAEILLQHKANPNVADDQGHVAINDAVAKDRFDIVTKLLEHGALVNVRNMAGLEAISFSRTPQMQSIIMKNDINF